QGLSTIDTADEVFPGSEKYAAGPYGLGVRVPMIIISPWSKGGWVNSEVFDHTSMIRFLERRFAHTHHALRKTNISPWRRAVAGDLTSNFVFSAPSSGLVALPSTIAYAPPDNAKHPDYVPHPPVDQALPGQEKGTRPARAVPYELQVDFDPRVSEHAVRLQFHNTGKAAAVFQVRESGSGGEPRSYTVGAHAKLEDTWASADGAYDLSVYGPNGFFRRYKANGVATDLRSRVHYEKDRNGITLALRNKGQAECKLRIADAYGKTTAERMLQPGKALSEFVPLEASFGWYDLKIAAEGGALHQIAGHLETGEDSKSDPALG
ncbi:MAG: phospholipase domain-containing protein, partial [Acidobacteriaceae bacterium]